MSKDRQVGVVQIGAWEAPVLKENGFGGGKGNGFG